MKKNILKYESEFDHFPNLEPIKKFVPKWYKEIDAQIIDRQDFNVNTIKGCMPFLDALTIGYTLTLAGDLVISLNPDGTSNISWGNTPLIGIRQDFYPTVPIPTGYDSSQFFWINSNAIELPNGYSALFTHPMNRFDLPFVTTSGIVDNYKMGKGSIPFFIKSGFEGVIPAGTPFVQIIPFKREKWMAIKTKGLYAEANIITEKSKGLLSGWYKKHVRINKTYE